MFLAPLNYDRFFNRVFSHEHIAQRFLEDVLDIEISKIELLPRKHRLTDKSAKVEFDFRCTTNGLDIIVDMQQWYKSDVVQRFYTYHASGTVLQLEQMRTKYILHKTEDKRSRSYDYLDIKPVITLIWMVDDTLRFEENFVGYHMTPEIARDFLENTQLWTNPDLPQLLAEHEKVMRVLQNSAKNLDFLPQNRLVFLFQPNIVQSDKIQKFHRWFQFAEKTRLVDNQEGDFESFKDDPIFKDIMVLINRKGLTKEDLDYIESESEQLEMFQRFLDGEHRVAKKDGKKEGIEEGVIIGREEGKAIGREEGKTIGREEGRHLQSLAVAEKCLLRGMSAAETAEITGLPLSEVAQLAEKLAG